MEHMEKTALDYCQYDMPVIFLSFIIALPFSAA